MSWNVVFDGFSYLISPAVSYFSAMAVVFMQECCKLCLSLLVTDVFSPSLSVLRKQQELVSRKKPLVAKLVSGCSCTQQAEGEIPSMLGMLCLDFSGTVQGISTAHCICQ